jgi:hypothetical protein
MEKKLPAIGGSGGTEERSPFKLPPDNEVFMLEEKKGGNDKKLKIWEKKTASCRNPLKRYDNFKAAIDDKYIPSQPYSQKEKKVIEEALQIVEASSKAREHAPKKEPITQVLNQKKEMFLVQMTHDTIEAEIQLLKDNIREMDSALKLSDKFLEDDSREFETFREDFKRSNKEQSENYERKLAERKKKEA